ncbi:MAG: hypothetical protein ACOC3V_05230 [bacterium]
MGNRDVIIKIFREKLSNLSKRFLKQIINADVENIKLNVNNLDNFVWLDGTWKDGTWEIGVWKGGIWKDGTWENGTWIDGMWYSGVWKNGTWVDGYILNPKTNELKKSEVSPSNCPWSLSYGK